MRRPFEEVASRRGRPPEDAFLRRLEIFTAIAPLLLRLGAPEVTMRRAARAANASVGTLYRYFDSKQDLLTFPLQEEACVEQMRRFEARHARGRKLDPERYIRAFLDEMVRTFPLLRASFAATVELGAEGFWEVMDSAIGAELEERLALLTAIRDGSGWDHRRRARSVAATYLGAFLDRRITPDELRERLLAILDAPTASEEREAASYATGRPLRRT